MTNTTTSKHLKSFWPLFTLVVISMVLGGVIYAVAFSNMLQDDLNSISFGGHRIPVAKTQTKTPAKTAPATSSAK